MSKIHRHYDTNELLQFLYNSYKEQLRKDAEHGILNTGPIRWDQFIAERLTNYSAEQIITLVSTYDL